MDIIKKTRKKVLGTLDSWFATSERNVLQNILDCTTDVKRIYFFCTPTHSNLGDQAQLYCWLRLMKEWYPSHEIVCVPTRLRQFKTLRTIRKNLKDGDLLYVHSGYLIFDPHPELPFILDVVRAFYDKHITILPQTVNLMGEWYREIVARTFNAHPDLTLFCRDEISFSNARALFPNVELELFPDVVTSLIGNKDFQYYYKRSGVLLCVRNDGEKLYTYKQIDELRNRFKGYHTAICDTTIDVPMKSWNKNREQLIRGILKKFSKYQVIITDRYHGTIFSQIVNTPVIVIASTDHKLSSGVNWFPNDKFRDNVYFEQGLDDIYSRVISILDREGDVKKNPTWFKDTYYSKRI